MRHVSPCDAVNARQTGEMRIDEDRQVAKVAARQTVVNFFDLRDDDVKVVEQPFACGADVAAAAFLQTDVAMRLAEDRNVVVQARKKSGGARCAQACGMRFAEATAVLSKPGRSENFGANRWFDRAACRIEYRKRFGPSVRHMPAQARGTHGGPARVEQTLTSTPCRWRDGTGSWGRVLVRPIHRCGRGLHLRNGSRNDLRSETRYHCRFHYPAPRAGSHEYRAGNRRDAEYRDGVPPDQRHKGVTRRFAGNARRRVQGMVPPPFAQHVRQNRGHGMWSFVLLAHIGVVRCAILFEPDRYSLARLRQPFARRQLAIRGCRRFWR